MAKHRVRFMIPERELGKVDLDFYVYADESKLGRMHISKGGVDWYEKGRQEQSGPTKRYTWEALSKLLTSGGAPPKKKRALKASPRRRK